MGFDLIVTVRELQPGVEKNVLHELESSLSGITTLFKEDATVRFKKIEEWPEEPEAKNAEPEVEVSKIRGAHVDHDEYPVVDDEF